METMLDLLRHTVATVAYRGGKAMRGAPAEFGGFKLTPDSPTPADIVAHLHDLFGWALQMCDGRREWRNSDPLPWQEGVDRFFSALQAFDDRLASGAPLGFDPRKIFQGPIADALTHVGQLAMLRRLAGCKIPGENYFAAHIETGVVAIDLQAPPVVEF